MKQTNKIIVGVAGALIAFGVIVWVARPDVPTAVSQRVPTEQEGGLAVDGTSSYDFGSVSMARGPVAREFRILNAGSAPVTVSKIYTSCMCTSATLRVGERSFGPFGMPGHGSIPSIYQAVQPNESATVYVVFDPAAHGPAGVGKIARTVTIENDGGRPVELSFTATVTP